jgi:hypothetical protein
MKIEKIRIEITNKEWIEKKNMGMVKKDKNYFD